MHAPGVTYWGTFTQPLSRRFLSLPKMIPPLVSDDVSALEQLFLFVQEIIPPKERLAGWKVYIYMLIGFDSLELNVGPTSARDRYGITLRVRRRGSIADSPYVRAPQS